MTAVVMFLNILALFAGLYAAFLWHQSSKVQLVSDMPDVMTHDGKPIPRDEAYGDFEAIYGTKRAVERAAALNSRAAKWTAIAVMFGTFVNMLGLLTSPQPEATSTATVAAGQIAVSSFSWISVVAAFGIGSVVAAIVGWFSAKAVAISNHRQNWINALRDDLAIYISSIDVVRRRFMKISGTNGSGTTDDLEALHDARNSALLVRDRIRLRLNMAEELHQDLDRRLNYVLIVDQPNPLVEKIEEIVIVARKILKQEWEVAKYGIFTKLIRCARSRLLDTE